MVDNFAELKMLNVKKISQNTFGLNEEKIILKKKKKKVILSYFIIRVF